MGRRRDVVAMGALLAAAAALLGWRASSLAPAPAGLTRAGAPAPLPRIDLNRASPAEIESLPGVGPKLAASIVASRPLRSLADLARVPGVGPKTAERLSPRVRF